MIDYQERGKQSSLMDIDTKYCRSVNEKDLPVC